MKFLLTPISDLTYSVATRSGRTMSEDCIEYELRLKITDFLK